MHAQLQWFSAIATLVVLALIVRRTLRTQTLRVWMLLAIPGLLVVLAGLSLVATPPVSTTGILLVVVGAVAGSALGYARGRHSHVALGPRPGTVVVQGNVILVAIFVAAFAVRFGVRGFIGTSGPLAEALSDACIVLAAASVAVARAMVYLAWRRLIGTQPAGTR